MRVAVELAHCIGWGEPHGVAVAQHRRTPGYSSDLGRASVHRCAGSAAKGVRNSAPTATQSPGYPEGTH